MGAGAVIDDGLRLEPLSPGDIGALRRLVEFGEIWREALTYVPTPGEVPDYVDRALRRQAAGRDEVYTIRNGDSREIFGTTRLQDIDATHRRAQIGSTWIGIAFRRRGASSGSKRMLLGRAFGELRLERVEFLVHPLNHASRRCIERTGARFEGVLSSYVRVRGVQQDRCVYAIVRSDWNSSRRADACRRHGARA